MNNAALKDSSPMFKDKDREASKNFSGKLPFRTQPEVHEAIFLAAKQAGKSINAWMEEVLRDASTKKGPLLSAEAVLPNPQSLQTLFQDNPDVVFELIDQIKPSLKSHKTRDTVVLMGEIEKLVTNYEAIRSQVKGDAPNDTAALIESVLITTETPDTTKGVLDCVKSIESTISSRLKQPDRDHLVECTRAFGQFLISVAVIRLYLKDSSLENTLDVIQQVMHHFAT